MPPRPYYYKVTLQKSEFKAILAQIPEMSETGMRGATSDWWKGRAMSPDSRRVSVFLSGYLTEGRLVQAFTAITNSRSPVDPGPIPGQKRPRWILVRMTPAVLDASTETARTVGQKASIIRANTLRHIVRVLFGLVDADPALADIIR